MRNTLKRTAFIAALVAGVAVVTTACGDRQPDERVGQKVDRSAEKVAAATDRATSNVAVAADDTAITTKVRSAVFAEPGLSSLRIGVDTKDGIVTLSGVVDTTIMKERALQIGGSVDGVRSVVDKLEIKTTG